MNVDKILDEIQNIRAQNNESWMSILKLAFRLSPDEAKAYMKHITECDKQVSNLCEKLIEKKPNTVNAINTITVKDIIKKYLKENEFDGLVDLDAECGCEMEDLFPCGEVSCNCMAAYKWPRENINAYNCHESNSLMKLTKYKKNKPVSDLCKHMLER